MFGYFEFDHRSQRVSSQSKVLPPGRSIEESILLRASGRLDTFTMAEVMSTQENATAKPSPDQHNHAGTFIHQPKGRRPIIQHSAQTQLRIKLLAAAFNVCANPSTPHVHKLARRTALSPAEVEAWFQKRRMLEEWCARESIQSASEIAAALTHGRLLLDMSKDMSRVGISSASQSEQQQPTNEEMPPPVQTSGATVADEQQGCSSEH